MEKSNDEMDAIFWDEIGHRVFICKNGKTHVLKNPVKLGIRSILSLMTYHPEKFSTHVISCGTIVISRAE